MVYGVRLRLVVPLVSGFCIVLLLAASSAKYAVTEVDWNEIPAWWPSPERSGVPRIRLKLRTVPFLRPRRQSDPVAWSDAQFLGRALPSVQVHPREAILPVGSPLPEHLLFAFTTTFKRASENHDLWQHYLRHGSPCILLLPPDEMDKKGEMQEILGRQCVVRVSARERYEDRVGSVVVEAKDEARRLPKVRWLVIGDDDTYWPDFRVLQRTLSAYTDEQAVPTGDHFIGGLTEAEAQFGAFGNQAYGGAGIIISMQLVQKMADRFEECLKYVDGVWTGGDGVLTYCAALVKGEDHHAVLQEEPGMHQMDVPGDGTGFFQAGLSFVSIHHYIDGWTDFFPKHCGLPESMHDDRRAIAIMTDSFNLLGGDNLFSRYIFDNGGTLVTLGYTVSMFNEALLPADLAHMEYTWSYDGYNLTLPQRSNLQEGDRKHTYYLEHTDAARKTQTFLTCAGERLEIKYDWL